jgi:hypothetical protein
MLNRSKIKNMRHNDWVDFLKNINKNKNKNK